MYMSVPIGPCGSCDPVVTLKPLWEPPGTELSTWSIGRFCCIRAIQRSRIASRPLRSYTAIQRYTALYTLYSYTSLYTIHAIQHPSVTNPAIDLVDDAALGATEIAVLLRADGSTGLGW